MKRNALKQKKHSKKNRLSIGADICLIENADFLMEVAKNNMKKKKLLNG